jgi:hypothetical protein
LILSLHFQQGPNDFRFGFGWGGTKMKIASLPGGRQRPDPWLQQAHSTTWRSKLRSWTSDTVSGSTATSPATRKARVPTKENYQRAYEPWGDQMAENPRHCTRVHIQNVNGFSLDSRSGQFDQFCAILKYRRIYRAVKSTNLTRPRCKSAAFCMTLLRNIRTDRQK